MGSWSPTIFGSDASLDCFDSLTREVGLFGSEGFFPTPEMWVQGEEVLVRKKEGEIEAWALEADRISRKACSFGFRLSLALLAMGAGIKLSKTFSSSLATEVREDKGFLRATSAADIHLALIAGLSPGQDIFPLLQEAGLIGTTPCQDISWQAIKAVLPNAPDIYGTHVRDNLRTYLEGPNVSTEISRAMEQGSSPIVFGDDHILSIVVAAVLLMSAGAKLSPSLRALAREAAQNDPDISDSRLKIRNAFLAAIEVYEEGRPIFFGEETLSQAAARQGGGLINR